MKRAGSSREHPPHATQRRSERRIASPKARGRRSAAPGRGLPGSAMRALVDDSAEGMILADQDGRILFANAASEPLLGYSPAELEGRIGFDFCRPDHLPIAREAFGRALARPGEAITLEADVIRRDGTARSLAVRLVNRLPVPAVNAVVVHFREATRPPAISSPEDPEQFRGLFQAAPIGLGVADLDGTLLAFNDAILQPGGYTREDIVRLGNVARLYADPAERDRVLALARTQGYVWRHEVQFRRKDGSSYDALLSLTPVRLGGRPCWYAAVEDLTDQKRAEEQRRQLEADLRQAQKMEAVGKMTAGIAHDFNNLLSIVVMNADLMAEALEREGREVTAGLVELQEAAQRGAAMVRKLLGFSRHTALVLEPTDLAAVVEGLRSMVRRLAPESIACELRLTAGGMAQADTAAVEQMILNLVTNACDAMPGGGSLIIEVSPAVLSVAERPAEWMEPGSFVRVSVTDTGVGMDPRTQARVFEPFFTTKPPGAGTGLGLAMVYGLVKQHGGFVEVRSRVGHGTTVSLYFRHAPDRS